jgi:tRNA A-37 threonylcarbamoyl transferase component Bud32
MSLEGQKLGEFEILERLGQGGMGAVYKARQITLHRLVALKTLQSALAEDPEFIARFRREATAAAALNHPNLVQVYSAGETEGVHWFAMEFVAGESAQARVKRKGRLETAEAIAIAMHVATALDYGWHKAHLIHRDIKPDNIFLSEQGEVKLGDLGLAKSLDQTQNLTMTGTSMGTPHYISPEQAQAKKDVDLRADIYSLGCTLFHLLTGQTPYQGDTVVAVLLQHVNAPVAKIRAALPGCPEPLARTVSKMMAKSPAARQQDYTEVVADLRRAHDVVTGAAVPAVLDVTQPPGGRAPGAHPHVAATSETKSGALWGLILLAVLAIGGYFAWQQFGKAKPQPEAGQAKPSPAELPSRPQPEPTLAGTEKAPPATPEIASANVDAARPQPMATPPPVVEPPQSVAMPQLQREPETTSPRNDKTPAPVPVSAPANAGGAKPASAEPGFAPLFDANGIRDWRQTSAAKWEYTAGVLSCRVNKKLTTRLWAPGNTVPAHFEIRFSVRGDRGPSIEFRQTPGGGPDDCYRLSATELKTKQTIIWGVHGGAKAGQPVRVTREDQREELPRLETLPQWKDGDWNHVTLIVQGNHFACSVNSGLVADLIDESPTFRAGPGDFGFRVTNSKEEELSVEFKDIRIRRLAPVEASLAAATPAAMAPGFVPLFDANGIREWRRIANGEWDYVGGVLSCRKTTKGTARLWSPANIVPADFEIQFSQRGNGGPTLEFRQTTGGASDDCYRFDPPALRFNGTIFWTGKHIGARTGERKRLTHEGHPEDLPGLTTLPQWKGGDWNQVTLSAQGSHFSCSVNGGLVAEFTDESPTYRAGPGDFGFRMTNSTDAESTGELKDIRIRRLPPVGTPAPPAAIAGGARELPANGAWLDVIPLVQLPRDLSVGSGRKEDTDWRIESGALTVSKSGKHGTISPGFSLPDSYDLSLRVRVWGNDPQAGVQVPVGEHVAMVLLTRTWPDKSTISGFDEVNGKIAGAGAPVVKPSVLKSGTEQLVEIAVRRQGEMASVELKVEGRPMLKWQGREAELSLHPSWPRLEPHRLALAATETSITWRDVRVRRVAWPAR